MNTNANLSPEIEKKLLQTFESVLPQSEAVIIEDYAKGLLSEPALQKIVSIAKKHDVPVMVDPNRMTPARFYNGATLMTPNREEAVALSGLDYDELHAQPNYLLEVGEAILQKMDLKHLIITRKRRHDLVYGRAGFSSAHVRPTSL